MTAEKVDRTDLSAVYNRVSFPSRYETKGDADRVQWAARRAIAALHRLNLECEIGAARNAAMQESRSASRNRALLSSLVKLRGQRP